MRAYVSDPRSRAQELMPMQYTREGLRSARAARALSVHNYGDNRFVYPSSQS